MASREVGGVHVALSAGVARFRRDMKKAEKSIQGFEKRAKKLSKTADKLERTGGALTRSLTLPLAAAGAAAVKFAADAEESANKFDVVMGDAAERVRGELEEMTATIPATRAQLESLAAGLQDLLVPMGVARDEAAGMSADMVKLAGDLGSFNNVAPTRVLEAMKSALAGASEPMRRFGVDTREAALDAIALKHGLIEAGEEMDSAARAQAVMLAIQQDSTDAIGDAARTVDSAANSFKFLKRDLREVGEQIGRILLPAARDLAQMLTRWLDKFDDLDESTQKLIVATAGIAAALGPLSFALGKAIRGWIALRKAMIAVRAVSLSTMGVIGVGAAAGAGLIFGLVKLEEALTRLPPRVKETREEMDKLTESIEGLSEAQILARMVEVTDQLLEANQRFLEARRELQGDVSAGRGFGGLTGARTSAKLEGLEGEMRAAKAEADIFNQTLDKIREALIRVRSASDNAASGVDNVGDAASDAAAETGELSQRMVETTERLEQMRIDRVTKMLEEYSGAMEDASELNTEMADTAGDLVAVNGELVDISRAVRGGTDDAADSTSDLADELERAARTGIDFARTLGLIGDSAAATLGSVVNLGSAVGDVVKGISSGASFGSMLGPIGAGIGAIGGIVSGLLGDSGPSKEQQAAQRRSQELSGLRQNIQVTVALLTETASAMRDVARNIGKDVLDALRELGDEFDSLAFRGVEDLREEMEKAGVTLNDLQAAARAMGINIDDLIQILVTGEGDVQRAQIQFNALGEVIDRLPDVVGRASAEIRALMNELDRDLRRFGEGSELNVIRKTLEKLLDAARVPAEVAARRTAIEAQLKEERERLRELTRALESTENQQARNELQKRIEAQQAVVDALVKELGNLATGGGPLFQLIDQLQSLDLTSKGGRTSAITSINEFIDFIRQKGQQLPEVSKEGESALEGELIALIELIRGVAEGGEVPDIPGGGGGGGGFTPPTSPEPPEVSRPDFIRRAVVTEAQASQILAGNRTRNVRLLQIRDLMQTQNAIIGALPRSIRKNVDVALAEDASLAQTAA